RRRLLPLKNNGMMIMKRLGLRFTSLAMALFLAGCAVGPDYQRPEIDVPDAYKEATLSPEAARQWKLAQPAEAIARGHWWEVFDEPVLNQLQEQAMSANQDLKVAAARVRQARALVQNAEAGLFPSLDAGFGPMRQRASNAAQGLPDDAG